MDNQRTGMFVPALIGGAVAGILSAIPFFNCLCCLWIMGGALLAVYLYAKDSAVSLRASDGAIIGIFTGIAAAVINVFANIPLSTFNRELIRKWTEKIAEYAEEVPWSWEEMFEGGTSVAWFFLSLMFSAVIFSALGALGGVIGVSLFGKKVPRPTQGASDGSQDASHRQP